MMKFTLAVIVLGVCAAASSETAASCERLHGATGTVCDKLGENDQACVFLKELSMRQECATSKNAGLGESLQETDAHHQKAAASSVETCREPFTKGFSQGMAAKKKAGIYPAGWPEKSKRFSDGGAPPPAKWAHCRKNPDYRCCLGKSAIKQLRGKSRIVDSASGFGGYCGRHGLALPWCYVRPETNMEAMKYSSHAHLHYAPCKIRKKVLMCNTKHASTTPKLPPNTVRKCLFCSGQKDQTRGVFSWFPKHKKASNATHVKRCADDRSTDKGVVDDGYSVIQPGGADDLKRWLEGMQTLTGAFTTFLCPMKRDYNVNSGCCDENPFAAYDHLGQYGDNKVGHFPSVSGVAPGFRKCVNPGRKQVRRCAVFQCQGVDPKKEPRCAAFQKGTATAAESVLGEDGFSFADFAESVGRAHRQMSSSRLGSSAKAGAGLWRRRRRGQGFIAGAVKSAKGAMKSAKGALKAGAFQFLKTKLLEFITGLLKVKGDEKRTKQLRKSASTIVNFVFSELQKTKFSIAKTFSAVRKEMEKLNFKRDVTIVIGHIREQLLLKAKLNPCGVECICMQAVAPMVAPDYLTTVTISDKIEWNCELKKLLGKLGFEPNFPKWTDNSWEAKYELPVNRTVPGGHPFLDKEIGRTIVMNRYRMGNSIKKKKKKAVCTAHFQYLMTLCRSCCCKQGLVASAFSTSLVMSRDRTCGSWFGMNDVLFRAVQGVMRLLASNLQVLKCSRFAKEERRAKRKGKAKGKAN